MDTSLFPAFIIALLVGLLGLAAVSDVDQYRIPNRVSLAVALLYPIYVVASPMPISWMAAMAVAAAFFVIGFVLFAFGQMGGGDVKLMAATALWAGPDMAFDFLFVMAIAGGLLGLLMTSRARFGFAITLDAWGSTGVRDMLLSNVMPYGLAIAAGGLFVAARLL